MNGISPDKLLSLLNLKQALEETVQEFYGNVFGIASGPMVEVDLYGLFGLSEKSLTSSSQGWIIYVSPGFLISLKVALDTIDMDRILKLLPLTFNVSLYQFLIINRQGKEYSTYPEVILSSMLELLYFSAGYLNSDRIKEAIKRFSTPEKRLLIFGDSVAMALLDKKQLEATEKYIKVGCKYVKDENIKNIPYEFYAVCSVIEKIRVSEFLEDLKGVLSNQEGIDDILKKYDGLIKRI